MEGLAQSPPNSQTRRLGYFSLQTGKSNNTMVGGAGSLPFTALYCWGQGPHPPPPPQLPQSAQAASPLGPLLPGGAQSDLAPQREQASAVPNSCLVRLCQVQR